MNHWDVYHIHEIVRLISSADVRRHVYRPLKLLSFFVNVILKYRSSVIEVLFEHLLIRPAWALWGIGDTDLKFVVPCSLTSCEMRESYTVPFAVPRRVM